MNPSKVIGLVTLTLALPLVSQAQSSSAKFTASLSSLVLVEPTVEQDWGTLLSTTIKTPNKKDLLIGASLETSLFTRTQVKSQNGVLDSTTANAQIEVQILIDGDPAFPGAVVYDKRKQVLSAQLGGILGTCQDTGVWVIDPTTGACTQVTDPVTGLPLPPDGILTIPCECSVTPEMIELVLDTTAAHHFNFVAKNLAPGSHTVELQVRIGTAGTTDVDATATAAVGKGSLTVEEVRATNAPDGITFLQ